MTGQDRVGRDSAFALILARLRDMNGIMRLFWLPGVLACRLVVAAPSSAGPTTRSASPCSQRVLPLAIGNQWTYSLVPAQAQATDPIARIAPTPPNKVVVTVKSIDSEPGGDTVIALEETTSIDPAGETNKSLRDERTIATSIRCNAKKFELSPDSFWFAGEPGGYLGLKLDTVERVKGTSLQLSNGRIAQAAWREDLLIRWTRVPFAGAGAAASSGKLELERQFTAPQRDRVETKIGTYNADTLGLVTTGRVTTDQANAAGPSAMANAASVEKPMELPANWIATLWIAEGAGVVQTLNPFAHKYQLSAVTLK